MKKAIFFIIFPLLSIILPITDNLCASSRDINIISKHGDILNLYKNYNALVIGIANHETGPRLANVVNDPKEVSSKLKELGFKVMPVPDLAYREIKRFQVRWYMK